MKACKTIAEIMAVPFYSQFTEEQIRAQVAKSAEGLRKMQTKALTTSKKVRGYTATQLDQDARRFENMLV